ncbi:helix-turn-helix domain-containing protein [Amycolatopsis sp. NPDC059657]|uniref:helix-turn-helix domain-containing protein n=1 Tax=Amycolatopsis sp. NPDC059657 TaxID=3346899 RepID=UPI00366DB58A
MEGDPQRMVGRKQRAYRLERGLRQERFADVASVHRTYMGGLERGEWKLTLKSLERIARQLEVAPQPALVGSDGRQLAWVAVRE